MAEQTPTSGSSTRLTALSPAQMPIVPPAPAFYRLRYLRDGYVLADAFLPGFPRPGEMRYTVDAAALGEHTDDELILIARQTAPQGYWLQHIEAIGGEPHRRDVFKQAVPGSVTSNNRLAPSQAQR